MLVFNSSCLIRSILSASSGVQSWFIITFPGFTQLTDVVGIESILFL